MNYSVTMAGVLTLLLGWYSRKYGLNIGEGEVNTIVNAILAFAEAATPLAFGAVYYGRYRQGDITWYGSKTK